jgi:multicomponent Na+:H+ antiporter subunit D
VSATTSAVHQLAPIAIAAPIIVACLLVAISDHVPRAVTDGVATLTAFGCAAVLAVLVGATGDGRVVTWAGHWMPVHGRTVGISLVADRLGTGLALVAAILVGCALLYGWRYFESVEGHYHALVLLFLAGMVGFTLSGDLFNMFVFFELMGACGYALTAFKIEDKAAVHGGLNFGIINSLGAYLTATGLGLLYSRTGQLGLPQLSRALAGHRADALVVAAFVLVSTGWLVKAAVVPFHFWTADVEAVAPSPICTVFSGAMVELGVYGVARVYWVVFDGTLDAGDTRHALLCFGVVTAIVGAVMCLGQRDFKRLLAFSTIAHVGLFLTAVGVLTSDGLGGAAVYVAGQAGVKGALFLLAGVVLNRYRSVDEAYLHDRGSPRDPLGWLIVVAGLGLAGLPPFGTSLGKALSEEALQKEGFAWGPVLFVAVSALTGGAVLRMAGRVFFGLSDPPESVEGGVGGYAGDEQDPETAARLDRMPPTMVAAIAILLGGGLAVGVVPAIVDAISAGAQRFVERGEYVRQALDGAPAAPLALPPVGWTTAGVLLGLLSALIAVLVAGAALYHDRLQARIGALAEAGRLVMLRLHRLHSGHIGDYVTWLFVGVAALAAFLGLPLAL